MSRTLSPLFVALLAVAFTAAEFSFGANVSRIVPAKEEKLSYQRIYTADFLKNHPLQMVTRASLTLRNTKGLLTATWGTTIRNIRSDEKTDLSATGICKVHGAKKIECSFDASAGNVNLTAQAGGLSISIPPGQGVYFSRVKDGVTQSENLLGDDDDNNSFRLTSK